MALKEEQSVASPRSALHPMLVLVPTGHASQCGRKCEKKGKSEEKKFWEPPEEGGIRRDVEWRLSFRNMYVELALLMIEVVSK